MQAAGKEFHYTDADFNWVRKEVYDRVGITLNESKREMVYARVARRLRQLGLSDFKSYRQYIENNHSGELIEFANAITTNVTSFFRENHHFEALRDEILPELFRLNVATKQIRVWSAGCSSGEEPYSIAITLLENLPVGWKASIIASDIDTHVIETARKGVYPIDRLSGIPASRLKKWFWKGKGANADKARVVPELQKIIEFKQVNLMEEWPIKGPFDFIFCRNVIIYFDKEIQRRLFERYANILRPDGWMFLGHSESLHGVSDRFQHIRKTMHRKIR